jgi:CRISPR/Cas system-associated exonuclease Cas4 (RecB family)
LFDFPEGLPQQKETKKSKNTTVVYEDPNKHFLTEELEKRFNNLGQHSENNNYVAPNPNYIRISELVNCHRKIFYRLTKAPKSFQRQESHFRMSLGSSMHEIIQNSFGDYLTDVETRFEDKELEITGSVDGVHFDYNEDGTINYDKSFILDFKISGFSTFLLFVMKNVAKKAHRRQLLWYTYLYNKHKGTKLNHSYLMSINRNIDPAFVSYSSFDFNSGRDEKEMYLADMRPEFVKNFYVKYDEEEVEKMLAELQDLRYRVNVTKRPPPKLPQASRYMCDGCGFKLHCFAEKEK